MAGPRTAPGATPPTAPTAEVSPTVAPGQKTLTVGGRRAAGRGPGSSHSGDGSAPSSGLRRLAPTTPLAEEGTCSARKSPSPASSPETNPRGGGPKTNEGDAPVVGDEGGVTGAGQVRDPRLRTTLPHRLEDPGDLRRPLPHRGPLQHGDHRQDRRGAAAAAIGLEQPGLGLLPGPAGEGEVEGQPLGGPHRRRPGHERDQPQQQDGIRWPTANALIRRMPLFFLVAQRGRRPSPGNAVSVASPTPSPAARSEQDLTARSPLRSRTGRRRPKGPLPGAGSIRSQQQPSAAEVPAPYTSAGFPAPMRLGVTGRVELPDPQA